MQVALEDLDFEYAKGFKILEDVEICIDKPQLVSIVGPNGVGKSTLIHCMNKILEPTGGIVRIYDKDVKHYGMKELAKKMSYVPCATREAFPMLVIDTVMMGRNAQFGRKMNEEDLDAILDLLRLLGIEELAMRPFNELSSGQRQKVAIARGLAQEPRILLLDEPTANLDVKHQMDVTRILKRLSVEKGILVIMICHDLNIASKYSDHIIMMHQRRIYRVGTPFEVFTEENLKTVYQVDSKIIVNGNKPYIILEDPVFESECLPVEGIYCGTGQGAETLGYE